MRMINCALVNRNLVFSCSNIVNLSSLDSAEVKRDKNSWKVVALIHTAEAMDESNIPR